MPLDDGIAAVQRARELFGVPVIGLADPRDQGVGKEALEAGAFDVIGKPAIDERIESAIRNALKITALEEEIARIRRELENQPHFTDIVAASSEMQRAVALAQRAAHLDLPVLLEGEPGTGKELFARTIRAASHRAAGPFVVLRCGGRPYCADNGSGDGGVALIERSWSESADGVLFIEEIGDLLPPGQEKLAECIVTQGLALEHRDRSVRLICSSSKNIIERVRKGEFREDLFYRINVFPIWLPPLRDRTEDIPALAKHFLRQVVAEEGRRIDEIDETALRLLQAYVWPGNVRQLENAVFRAVVLADAERLTVEEFPQIAAQVPGFNIAVPAAPSFSPHPHYEGPAIIGGAMPAARPITLAPMANGPILGIPALTETGEVRRLEEIEADLIRLALGHYRGHITEVARRLGIGRSTLYRKMREFGLDARHN
jgi:DNA-binding NtrC family response regulator